MNKAIIVDLDGTLANCDVRRGYAIDANGKMNWDKFFSNVIDDPVNTWCREIMRRFAVDHEIVLVTGRPEKLRNQTIEWLLQNNIPYSHLFMRKDGDFRSDVEVKNEIYEQEIRSRKLIVEFAIDDRQSVVDLWRSRGIVCLQCAKGDF